MQYLIALLASLTLIACGHTDDRPPKPDSGASEDAYSGPVCDDSLRWSSPRPCPQGQGCWRPDDYGMDGGEKCVTSCDGPGISGCEFSPGMCTRLEKGWYCVPVSIPEREEIHDQTRY